MSSRARLLIALILAAVAVVIWFSLRHSPSSLAPASPKTSPVPNSVSPAPTVAGPGTAEVASALSSEPPFVGIERLNAPEHTIQDDLRLLSDLFLGWQTNFPRQGNPWGENAEITAALAGKNPLHLAMIPPRHPAINAQGELTDRWGTPFVFHQLSGTQMEIRSAGPDRKLYTEDDAVLAP